VVHEQGESYELLLKSNSGSLKSAVITGFEIPIRAIFDEKENLKALRKLCVVHYCKSFRRLPEITGY